ncbi:MAG: glutaredoxin domain-containing protein [Micrococcus sp.]|nr:glutaredoxin domain-containing protein [Micrococcus sp.]
MRLLSNPWLMPAAMVVIGLSVLVLGAVRADMLSLAAGVLIIAFSATYLPATRVRSQPASGARAHVEAGGVVMFWRPGCPHCRRLLRFLSREEREQLYWVNVWATEDATALVREVHERRTGRASATRPDETVPTVLSRRQAFVVKDEDTRQRVRDMLRGSSGRTPKGSTAA